jgi:tRNA A37 N6-isopentenylltransferase MiaA
MDREKGELESRIRDRIKTMIDSGWVEETLQLRKLYPRSRVLQSVGYRQIMDHLDGKTPEGRKIKPGIEGLIDEIGLAHRQLAKQQRTWFKNVGFDREFLLDRDLQTLKDSLMKLYQ